jgi:Ribbon-helix-helix domain
MERDRLPSKRRRCARIPRQRIALSLFVEEAVKARLFELTVADLRQQNAHLSADEIMDAVDDALEWVRRR